MRRVLNEGCGGEGRSATCSSTKFYMYCVSLKREKHGYFGPCSVLSTKNHSYVFFGQQHNIVFFMPCQVIIYVYPFLQLGCLSAKVYV